MAGAGLRRAIAGAAPLTQRYDDDDSLRYHTRGRGEMRHRITAALLLMLGLLATLGWAGQCWAQAKIERVGL